MKSNDTVDAFDESGQLCVMPSVYSVPFAETNSVFDHTNFPTKLWNVTASRSDFDEILGSVGLGPLREVGEKKLGLMDMVHQPVVDGILAEVARSAVGLDDESLRWRYPLHGSALGITYLMNHLRVVEGVDEICVLKGDYEGYSAQAANSGLKVRFCGKDDALSSRGQIWFVSNPSAIDGELLDPGLLETLVAHNRVVVDIAYHGLCGPVSISVPAGTWAALWSLSKPWGLFWRRVGVMAVADEIPCAYGTRWYKDPLAVLSAWNVVRAYEPSAMADAYRWAQEGAVEVLGEAGVLVHPSNTLLLGLMRKSEVSEQVWDQVARAERIVGSGVARVCLSPLIEQFIARGQ
jgi:hypothetical protein